ncbi:MAG: sulfotransferase [Myxococcota bacterium]|nr:sulfotransferase [Myxococcota bacterium]
MDPVFIGGAGRSGTTLMVDVLGLHPALSPVYETHFVVQLIDILGANASHKETARAVHTLLTGWSETIHDMPQNKRAHERYHHGPHHLRFTPQQLLEQRDELIAAIHEGRQWAGLQRLVHTLFSQHAQADGKPHWINKNPSYVLRLPQLVQLFPRMRFIHCVRDGRAAAASVLTRPWGPKTVPEAAQWWGSRVLQGLRFQQAYPQHALIVRYEDVLAEPERTLGAVQQWLGVPDGQLVQQHLEAGFSFDPSRGEAWRERLSAQDLADFDRIAGKILRACGYENQAAA